MKAYFAHFAALSLALSTAMAVETVYVTARPQNCTVTADCPGPNTDGTYFEHFPISGDFGAAGTALGRPQTTVSRLYYGGEITDPANGVTIIPNLSVAGGIYSIEYNFNSLAGNTSPDLVMAVTSTNATLSFSETDKLQRSYGSPADRWNLMGYVTNNPGVSQPTITFTYKSGQAGGTDGRVLFDAWKFTHLETCSTVPELAVLGPLGASMSEVYVTNVVSTATKIIVYQSIGGGAMVQIGSKTTDIIAGRNTVPVGGLVKNAQVAATQTVAGQEGCVPSIGALVGGGANPAVKIALTIREQTNVNATVGAPGYTGAGTPFSNLHFLGASVANGAPLDAPVFYPSNGWQTVSFTRDSVTVAMVEHVTGTPSNNIPAGLAGYGQDIPVDFQVYAFRKGTNSQGVVSDVFSRAPSATISVTNTQAAGIVWKWDAVPKADGYKVFRGFFGTGFYEASDVATNVFVDWNQSEKWLADTTVNTNGIQNGKSVQWNPSLSNTNNLPGQWGTLESINFAIGDMTDVGPFDIYIDNLQNGTNVFQTFEEAPARLTDYGFRAPGLSGSTSPNLLDTPNVGEVSNRVADEGSKSLHLAWQWSGLTTNKWLRLTTSGAKPASNPMVNLDEPISFRMLLLPVGASLPTAPPAPSLTAAKVNGETVLNWSGGHRLQSSLVVTGAYANLSQTMVFYGYSNGFVGPFTNQFLAPYTNTSTEPVRFFRLAD